MPSSRRIWTAGLLLREPMQRLAQLVEVGLRLGLDRHLQRRRREVDRRQLHRLRPIGDQGVAGGGRVQLGHGGDVAGSHPREVLLVLALDREEVADALVLAAVDVVDVALAGHAAGDDAEVGQAADERVGGCLEHLRHERPVRIGRDLLAVGRGARADLGGGGDVLDDHADELADADVPDRRADEDRHHAALARALVHRRLDLGVGERLALEVLLHELVGRLGGGLDEGVAPRVLDPLELGGDGHLGRLAVLVDGGVLLDDVDVAAERIGGADREVDGRDLRAESGLQLVERRVVVRVLAVHLVDEDQARQPARVGELPDLLGADLDAGGGIDHHDGRVDRGERLDHIGLEVGVAGRVDDRDAGALVLDRADGEVDALPALLLVGVPVERGRARLHGAEPVDRAGIEEHRLCEARLAGATVGDEGDVPDPVGGGRLHRCSLRMLMASRRGRWSPASGGRWPEWDGHYRFVPCWIDTDAPPPARPRRLRDRSRGVARPHRLRARCARRSRDRSCSLPPAS